MEGKIVGKPNRYYAQLVNMPDFVKSRYAYNILKYRRLEIFIIENLMEMSIVMYMRQMVI